MLYYASESEFISLLLPLDSKFFTYELFKWMNLPQWFFAVQHLTSLRIDCCSSPWKTAIFLRQDVCQESLWCWVCQPFQCAGALQTVHYYASKSEFNSLLLKLDGIFQPLVCSRKRICHVMGLLLCQWRVYCRDKAQCIYPFELSRSFGVYQLTIFFPGCRDCQVREG
jgi:hypothetical protein